MPPGAAHDALAIGGLALIVVGCALLIASGGGNAAWVFDGGDGGGGDGGGDGGEDARGAHRGAVHAASVVRVLPLAACVVVFWAVYCQMSSNYQLQGLQMDLRVGGGGGGSALRLARDAQRLRLGGDHGAVPLVDRALTRASPPSASASA